MRTSARVLLRRFVTFFQHAKFFTRYRKLVSRAFTPRRIAAIEPRVREIAAAFLDEQVGSGGFDYVADFGSRLPVMVISALLGAPREDEAQLREWTDAMLHIEPGEMMGDRAGAIRQAVHDYWQALIDERRARPRDDLLSDLMATGIEEEDGTSRGLDDDEIGFREISIYKLIEALDRVLARLLQAEAAALRLQFVSGTHAIAAALFGILRPGDRLLAVRSAGMETTADKSARRRGLGGPIKEVRRNAAAAAAVTQARGTDRAALRWASPRWCSPQARSIAAAMRPRKRSGLNCSAHCRSDSAGSCCQSRWASNCSSAATSAGSPPAAEPELRFT